MDLTPAARAILQLLVKGIRDGLFKSHDHGSFLGYKQVHDLLGLQKIGLRWGKSLQDQGLEDLAAWARHNGLPAITGLIVSQDTFTPGDGYYEVNGRPLNDEEWWVDQVKAAIALSWSDHVEDDSPPTHAELHEYSLAVVEGRLVTLNVAARTRCEALRRRAKQHFRSRDGKLYCEVCGWVKPDNRISGDIVELHHLRPLADLDVQGVQITMAEAISALVPLCPCCHRIAHAKLGGGTFSLEMLKKIVPRVSQNGMEHCAGI